MLIGGAGLEENVDVCCSVVYDVCAYTILWSEIFVGTLAIDKKAAGSFEKIRSRVLCSCVGQETSWVRKRESVSVRRSISGLRFC